MNKKIFRKDMLLKRDEIPREIRIVKSGIIQNKVLASDFYKKANKILIYLNMRSEVITEGIIYNGLKDGKTMGLPLTFENREMVFIEIKDLEHLKKTKIGTLEPEYDPDKIIIPDADTLVIVPGCGFDPLRYRLGYGGGFYDTYIEKYPEASYIALAYEEQITAAVPKEAHDKQLNGILTDKNIYE